MGFNTLVLIPKLHLRVDRASSHQLQIRRVIKADQLLRVGEERALESAQAQIQSVNFICSTNCNDIGCVWVVDHIAAELGNPDLEVPTVLRMQFYVPIIAEQRYFTVVIR